MQQTNSQTNASAATTAQKVFLAFFDGDVPENSKVIEAEVENERNGAEFCEIKNHGVWTRDKVHETTLEAATHIRQMAETHIGRLEVKKARFTILAVEMQKFWSECYATNNYRKLP